MRHPYPRNAYRWVSAYVLRLGRRGEIPPHQVARGPKIKGTPVVNTSTTHIGQTGHPMETRRGARPGNRGTSGVRLGTSGVRLARLFDTEPKQSRILSLNVLRHMLRVRDQSIQRQASSSTVKQRQPAHRDRASSPPPYCIFLSPFSVALTGKMSTC